MKPTFHHRLVNGPYEDPCVYVRLLREKRALMFDAGDLRRLGQGDLLKLSDLFITHTHIDHFIGFDSILRALLRREQPLRVYGPANIADCVEGKLGGYTWNLIREYPLSIEVCAVDGPVVRRTGFDAQGCFERKDMGESPFSGLLLRDSFFEVRAVQLSHDIPCLAYSIEEDYHINIDKAALSAMGLPVGPWLSELKRAIRDGRPPESEIDVEGKAFTLETLKKAAAITRGQKISYVTDAAPSDENLVKIKELVKGSDTLYCEAYFLEEDRDRAVERNHLTARAAGRVAREAGVGELEAMHFSPKYRNAPITPLEEAAEEFYQAGGRQMATEQ